MNESSPAAGERARKAHTLALQRISRIGQATVAQEVGVSPATVSRFVSEPDGLERACKVLAAVGLKVVPVTMQCFPPEKVAIFMTLARDHLNYLQRPEQLAFEDDE
ncbi:MAG TPA: hypothetical protein VNS29_15310 [Burkholderiaceae bacterium]|nr:hypothetical protein [Burkholderiaceae bacterium]